MTTKRKFTMDSGTVVYKRMNGGSFSAFHQGFIDKYNAGNIYDNGNYLSYGASYKMKKVDTNWYNLLDAALGGLEDDYAGVHFFPIPEYSASPTALAVSNFPELGYYDANLYRHNIFPKDNADGFDTLTTYNTLTKYVPATLTASNLNNLVLNSKTIEITVGNDAGTTNIVACINLQGLRVLVYIPANTLKNDIATLIAAAINDGHAVETRNNPLIPVILPNLASNVSTVIPIIKRSDGILSASTLTNWYNKVRDYVSNTYSVKKFVTINSGLLTATAAANVVTVTASAAGVVLFDYVEVSSSVSLGLKVTSQSLDFSNDGIPSNRKGTFVLAVGTSTTTTEFNFETGTNAEFMTTARDEGNDSFSGYGYTLSLPNSQTLKVTSANTIYSFSLIGDTIEATFPMSIGSTPLISVRGLFVRNPFFAPGTNNTIRISKTLSSPIISNINTLANTDIFLYKFEDIDVTIEGVPTDFVDGRYLTFDLDEDMNSTVDFLLMEGVLYNFRLKPLVQGDTVQKAEIIGLNSLYQLELNNNYSKIVKVSFRTTGTSAIPTKRVEMGVPNDISTVAKAIEFKWPITYVAGANSSISTNGLILYNGIAEKGTVIGDFTKDFSDTLLDPIDWRTVCNLIQLKTI